MGHIVSEYSDARLLIVGEFWEDTRKYCRQIDKLSLNGHISIVDRYVPNEDVEMYFAAADIVVLPYTSGTGSGVVQIAYGCNKPVIATRVGCLPEVVEDGKTGLLVEPKNSAQIADAVISFYKHNMGHRMASNIWRSRHRFSWNNMVSSIEEVVQEIRA
jgi:glycosyltransferase involved in cell wall biosynthesis